MTSETFSGCTHATAHPSRPVTTDIATPFI